MIMSNDDSDTVADGKKKGQKKAKKSNKSKAAQRKSNKKTNEQIGNDLSAKIFATMEKHKEVFFVIRLHSAQSAASLAVSFFLGLCFEDFSFSGNLGTGGIFLIIYHLPLMIQN